METKKNRVVSTDAVVDRDNFDGLGSRLSGHSVPNVADASNERRFLDRLPDRFRGPGSDAFLRIVRSGVVETAEIVAALVHDCEDDNSEFRVFLLAALTAYADEARALASHAVAWVYTPRHSKHHLNESDRDAEYRRSWLRTQPPTDRQLGYLRSLGVTESEMPSDRHAASQMIDARLRAGGRQ